MAASIRLPSVVLAKLVIRDGPVSIEKARQVLGSQITRTTALARYGKIKARELRRDERRGIARTIIREPTDQKKVRVGRHTVSSDIIWSLRRSKRGMFHISDGMVNIRDRQLALAVIEKFEAD